MSPIVCPTVSEIEFGTPYGKEQQAMTKTGAARKTELADVLKLYQDLEKKVKGTPNALRYIQYRMAMLAVDRAKDDPAVDAVAALNDFPHGQQRRLGDHAGHQDAGRSAGSQGRCGRRPSGV